jgi:hypothetical protein
MRFFDARGARFRFFDVRVHFVLGGFAVGFFAYRFSRWRFVSMGQDFSGKLEVFRARGGLAMSEGRGCFVAVAVIVILEIFENVADIQESISVQTDIHECRLHARENASHSAFVNAADESEFFFALDIDFD